MDLMLKWSEFSSLFSSHNISLISFQFVSRLLYYILFVCVLVLHFYVSLFVGYNILVYAKKLLITAECVYVKE